MLTATDPSRFIERRLSCANNRDQQSDHCSAIHVAVCGPESGDKMELVRSGCATTLANEFAVWITYKVNMLNNDLSSMSIFCSLKAVNKRPRPRNSSVPIDLTNDHDFVEALTQLSDRQSEQQQNCTWQPPLTQHTDSKLKSSQINSAA